MWHSDFLLLFRKCENSGNSISVGLQSFYLLKNEIKGVILACGQWLNYTYMALTFTNVIVTPEMWERSIL